jgi:hypothetical protein
MSEEKSYCKWCDTLIKSNTVVKEYKAGRLVWVGCIDCFRAKTELKKKDVTDKE